MKVTPTDLPGVLVLEPRIFRDERGSFVETWNRERYAAAGLPPDFVQDNLSVSGPGVLRGLHYQDPNGQGKLVSVTRGSAYDVAVDIRVGSPTFRRWVGVELSDSNGLQLYIPPGFAHGFVVTGEGRATFQYKCSAPYDPASEGSVAWDDPDVGIPWPVPSPTLNAKDRAAPRLRDIPPGRLPSF